MQLQHWLLLASPLGALAAQKASFTVYGSTDNNGSGTCATPDNACGFQGSGYTAALSQSQFGPGANGGGAACGQCWQVTLDTDVNGSPLPQKSIKVQVDNECPIQNNPICDVPNKYGAAIHFDLCLDSGAGGAFFPNGYGIGLGSAYQVAC